MEREKYAKRFGMGLRTDLGVSRLGSSSFLGQSGMGTSLSISRASSSRRGFSSFTRSRRRGSMSSSINDSASWREQDAVSTSVKKGTKRTHIGGARRTNVSSRIGGLGSSRRRSLSGSGAGGLNHSRRQSSFISSSGEMHTGRTSSRRSSDASNFSNFTPKPPTSLKNSMGGSFLQQRKLAYN